MSDFLIIGAGVNGLLLARELLQAGAQVTLVDKAAAAGEASWAGGGIVSPLYPWRYPPAVSRLSVWAQDFYPALAAELFEETGIDSECDRSGLLILAVDDEAEAIQWSLRHGRELEQWDGAQLRQANPGLDPRFTGGLWLPQVANIRNPRLGQALRASVLARGGRLLENHEVLGFQVQSERVAAVHAAASAVPESLCLSESGQVIVCAGAWSGTLLHQADIEVDVRPMHGQMLLYKFPVPPVSSICLNNGRYLIPRRDGHLLVGSTLEDRGFDKNTDSESARILARSGADILPALAQREPIAHWAGLRPASPEGVPFIGRLPGYRNLWINAGHFRNGLVLAPASARLLGDLLLQRPPLIEPSAYDPQQRCRFGAYRKASSV